jgi:glycosyltransferase involved in cell wall biosynthesis
MNFIKNKVSIIIPSYNRFEYLQNAIHSCKTQTYVNKEIVVVDDASTDERYQNYDWKDMKDINYLRFEVNNRIKYNIGCANGLTRNEGIKISNGEYLAFLDDDDYYFSNKIEIQVTLMKKYGYLFSSTNLLKGNGKYSDNIKKEYFHDKVFGKQIDNGLYELSLQTIFRENKIALSSVIIHRNIYDEYGGFDLGVNEDYSYWKKIIHKYRCLYIDQPLLYYDLNHGDGKLYSDR